MIFYFNWYSTFKQIVRLEITMGSKCASLYSENDFIGEWSNNKLVVLLITKTK